MKHRISISMLILAMILFFILKMDWWYYALAVLGFSLVTFLGVVNMDYNWFLKNYTKVKNQSPKKIALTFDDGPTELTPKFLEILNKHRQKATFFCIGKQIEKFPNIFQQIIDDGHEIGNHSYSHSNKTGLFSKEKMVLEVRQNEEVFLKNGNYKTQLYRPPFGITNPNIAKAIATTNKKSIGWNIRSFDTAINDEQKILNRIIPNIKDGSIILMHDTSDKSFRVLEQILLFLGQENYQSVTISELFNFKS